MKQNPREIALTRSRELKRRIQDYEIAKQTIPRGLLRREQIVKRQEDIMRQFGVTKKEFDDWRWQLQHRIRDTLTLSRFIHLSEREKAVIDEVSQKYRWAISPYYLSLIDEDNPLDPIRLMSIPSFFELQKDLHSLDPMGEEFTNPAGAITRRYPDRLIINVTNECAMYCRFCQRRRNIGESDKQTSKTQLEESLAYIRDNHEIRDVLITGGDPLTLDNSYLEWILEALRSIEHVEIIRIGSRTPVTMPMRITDKLVTMLKKYHPLYLNTHFNHPQEVTEESKIACEKLVNAGIVLGNQAVLLNGINNDKFVMRQLNQDLLRIRVRPYYIFHAKKVRGTTHFNTSIDDGIEIMEYLRGYTSGLAIPYYIVNAPMGRGKTPIMPEYVISRGKNTFTIRTWEGHVVQMENPPTFDIRAKILEEVQKKG